MLVQNTKKLKRNLKTTIQVINDALLTNGTEADFDALSKAYNEGPLSFEKIQMTMKYADYLAKLNDNTKVKKGIDDILAFRKQIPEQFRGNVDSQFTAAFAKISKAKGAEIEDYIKANFK